MEKIKLALYWGAGCGGCDVAVLDLDAKILDVAALAEIVFWPIGFDTKLHDIENMPDGSITVSFYNGAIRNSENEHVAKVLRKKSKFLIAFGSCACFGGIPGLANVTDKSAIFEKVYKETPSTENPTGVVPHAHLRTQEGELTLPTFYDYVVTLDDVVEVDYYMPGCVPTTKLLSMALDAISKHVKEGAPLPPKGTVIASDKTLCDECKRERKDRQIKKIYAPHELAADPKVCLLDQGIICLGPATRAGCEAKCIDANQPCRGCMGPTSAVMDHGGSMLSALSSLLGVGESEGVLSEDDIAELMAQVKDPLGTFYSFTMPKSLLKRRVTERGRKAKEASH